jgi:hypothetical protein
VPHTPAQLVGPFFPPTVDILSSPRGKRSDVPVANEVRRSKNVWPTPLILLVRLAVLLQCGSAAVTARLPLQQAAV